jgi:threonylcarbamoyladenosine tRNA methylthiotransferase CDKAL1
MKIIFKTYGCTLNRADTEMMEAIARQGKHEIVENEDDADVVVVNTCTVKLPTENKIISYLNGLKKKGKTFVIAGCMTVDKKIQDTFNAPMLGPSSLRHINEAISDAAEGRRSHYGVLETKDFLPKGFTPPIARIAICDGCTDKCHFCQSRLARPKLISQGMKSIKVSLEKALGLGCREIELSGCDTGAYGLDIGTDVTELLKELCRTNGDFRIRLGMANPHHVKRLLGKLVNVYKNPKMFKFLHASVQSGSEKVAREMGRGHSVADFESIIKILRREIPDVMVETDIIVGYPTETEEDFNETMAMLERVRPDIVNLSKFTPRRGTVAAEMKQLPSETIKQRSVKVADLLKNQGLENNVKFLGKKINILVTEEGKGRANSYKQVAFIGKAELGSRIDVAITGFTHTTLLGKKI